MYLFTKVNDLWITLTFSHTLQVINCNLPLSWAAAIVYIQIILFIKKTINTDFYNLLKSPTYAAGVLSKPQWFTKQCKSQSKYATMLLNCYTRKKGSVSYANVAQSSILSYSWPRMSCARRRQRPTGADCRTCADWLAPIIPVFSSLAVGLIR